jgi:hypothetical protein
MGRTDRMIGISLGIVVGVVALILFVFLGSSGSIDAPSLAGQSTTTQQSPQAAP